MNAERIQGLTLRQAALVAGIAYLLIPVFYAEFFLLPKLIVANNAEQTVANISAHPGMFVGAMFCYLIAAIEDIVIAWALYVLLAPVNQALSLLAAWLRLIYAAVSLFGIFNLLTAYRMLTTPEYLTTFGAPQLHAQVNLLIHSFRYDYAFAIGWIFSFHLMLIGYLIARSRYIPWWIGALLVLDGVAWLVNNMKPYLYPGVNLGYISVAFLGEIVFMLWLLLFGWRIQEPSHAQVAAASA